MMRADAETTSLRPLAMIFLSGRTSLTAMRVIAVFEVLKALVVLAAGIEALRYRHRDMRTVAENLFHQLHVDPVERLPRLVLRLADRVNEGTLLAIAAGAIAYAAIRLAEAYGLWHNLNWAKWLGAVAGAIYIPYELYELGRGITPLRVVTFLVNVAIVVFLVWSIASTRHPGAPPARRPGGSGIPPE